MMVNPKDKQKTSSLLGLLDLTEPIREVYLAVLKTGPVSVVDFIQKTDLVFDKTEVKIYLDILVNQNYLEKYKDDNLIKYKIKDIKRGARNVPDSIWDKLDS
jgi:hypothetical protein